MRDWSVAAIGIRLTRTFSRSATPNARRRLCAPAAGCLRQRQPPVTVALCDRGLWYNPRLRVCYMSDEQASALGNE